MKYYHENLIRRAIKQDDIYVDLTGLTHNPIYLKLSLQEIMASNNIGKVYIKLLSNKWYMVARSVLLDYAFKEFVV